MKLFELKSSVQWGWEKMSPHQVVAKFTVQPNAKQGEEQPEPIDYKVDFTKLSIQKLLRFQEDFQEQLISKGITHSWDVEFFFEGEYGGREIALSGTGGEMQVFATVLQILDEFLNMINPNSINFSADVAEPSRVKLYNRLLGRFQKQGWQTTQVDDPRRGTKVYIAWKS